MRPTPKRKTPGARGRAPARRARQAPSASHAPGESHSERLKLLAHLVETSSDAISIADRHGRITYANRAFARMYGYDPEEVPGLLAGALDSPRNEPWIRDETSSATPSGGWSGVLYQTRRDGTEFPASLTTSPVTDVHGQVLGVVRVVRDVARTLAVEEALRRSEEQFRSIVESALDAIVTLSPQGMIESYNPAARRLFGWDVEEIRGRPAEVLFPSLLGSMGVLPRMVEIDGVRKEGSRVPLEVSLSLQRTSAGHAVVAFLRDVSERREIERLKDEFVTTVSHDLKTPLTAVGLSLGIVLDGEAGVVPAPARAVLEVAQRNVGRMVKLADDLLDLKRIEAGGLELRRERLDLPALVERGLEMVRAVAAARRVSLEVHGRPAAALGDPERVSQVLLNLLSNAIKFSPEGGRVRVELEATRGMAEVRVRDEGPGVAPAHRERIFDRFRQAPSAPGSPKGSGLGLAIARAIVRQHGGTIGLSLPEGGGSCFWFRLPLAP